MAERRGAAPAGPRQSDDALQKTRQQTRPFSPRKRPKTMQNDLRSSLLAPFRADRATAASDIVHHVADDDLRRVRQQRLVRCRSMCGPRFSPGRGFGQKSRRGSRDLAGTLPATTACARGGWSRKSARGPMPRQATFPAWPFLGPAASFAAGSSARRLVERNGARPKRPDRCFARAHRAKRFAKRLGAICTLELAWRRLCQYPFVPEIQLQ